MPSRDRVVSHASLAASVILITALTATIGVVAWPRVAAALGVASSKDEPAYRTGQRFDAPPSWYDQAPRTLVIFARASCGACEKAQPFLAELVRHLQGRSAVMMAGPSATRDDDRRYAEGLGLTAQNIAVVPDGLRVRATPTLVLVNQQGEILEAWEGVGTAGDQAAIVKAIDAALR